MSVHQPLHHPDSKSDHTLLLFPVIWRSVWNLSIQCTFITQPLRWALFIKRCVVQNFSWFFSLPGWDCSPSVHQRHTYSHTLSYLGANYYHQFSFTYKYSVRVITTDNSFNRSDFEEKTCLLGFTACSLLPLSSLRFQEMMRRKCSTA